MYAKLSPPDASRLLSRARLQQRLDESRGGVVWVSGPAGAGKTSLLGRWVRDLSSPALWYRVDADDHDPVTIFEWLTKGLNLKSKSALPRFAAEHMTNLPHFARRFFRAYFATAGDDAVLVFDNVHEALHEPGFAAILGTMLAERPPATTLVFSSRLELDGDWAQVQAGPEHRHIRWSDLRCTDEEAIELARLWRLAAPSVDMLRRVDGWMAALAVMLRQAGGDAPTTLRALDSADIFETFAAKAFDRLRPEQQRLLLMNAFSPWIDARSTDELCGSQDTAIHLDALWREQFFIERRLTTEGRAEYVCHALLRAFLQHRAGALWSAEELRRHCRHHARTLEGLGDIGGAIACHSLACDWPRIADLIDKHAPALLASGRLATLAEWIQSVPEHDARRFPTLAYWQGTCLVFQSPPQAIECFKRAHAGHLEKGETLAALLDVCALMDAYFIQWEYWEQARPWADELARLNALMAGRYQSLDVEVRVVSNVVGLMFPHFDQPAVKLSLERAEEILRTSTSPAHQLALAGFLIGYYWWAGYPAKIREVSRLASQALARAEASPVVAFPLQMWVGIGAYSDGRAAEPELANYLDRVLQLGETSGVHIFDFHAWCHKIMEAMAVDDPAAASHALSQAQRLSPGARGARQLLTLCQIAERLTHRDWQAAADLALACLDHSPDFGGWTYGAQAVRTGLAQALAMLGQHDRARAHLAGPADFARRLPSPYLRMTIAFILAAGAYAAQDVAEGDEHLREALGLARAQGFRHLHPWWSPPFHAPLLARALAADIETAWVTQLIRLQRVAPPSAGVEVWPHPIRIHTLGRFSVLINQEPLPRQGKAQRRVLELLKILAAQGGRDIAVDALAADLWPDSDGDAGLDSFDVTLHRARKLLGDPASLLLHDGRLSFNPALVCLDLWVLTRLTEVIDQSLRRSTPTAFLLKTWTQDLFRHYSGPLLASEPDEPWLVTAREIWRRRFERHVLRLADAAASGGLPAQALDLHARLLEVDPLAEPVVRAQLSLLNKLGRHDEANHIGAHVATLRTKQRNPRS
jgi:DNA-binding SARP family transcriptional activator